MTRIGRIAAGLGSTVIVAMSCPAVQAGGKIESIQTSKHALFDRIKFDLGVFPVGAASMACDSEIVVEMDAKMKRLDHELGKTLSALGVYVELLEESTRVTVDLRGRSVRVFRTRKGNAGQGDRIVLDLSKAEAQSFTIPESGWSIMELPCENEPDPDLREYPSGR